MLKSTKHCRTRTFIFSSKFKLNPHAPIDIIYNIKNNDGKKVAFNLIYKLPEIYHLDAF